MKILVYEHVSGGGFAGTPISPGILCEGFGMLRTLIADFQAAGHFITTSLDSRIAAFQPLLEAERVVSVFSSGQAQATIRDLARFAEAVCVIAPESNGILESLVAKLEGERIPLINSPSRTIAVVSNKDALLKHARKIGLSTPNSLTIDVHDSVSETVKCIAKRIGFPAVFKPISGAGMTGLSLVQSEAEVAGGIAKVTRESTSDRFIAQEFVKGVSASVSLVSTGEEAMAVSLNKQAVTLSSTDSVSTYDGGEVPLECLLEHDALSAAERIAESYEGLKGYVGVDFVLTEEVPVVIEVNPRLTTSYIGLQEVTVFNAGQAILEAAIQHKLPTDKTTKGWACFSKTKTTKLSSDALRETFKMKSVVSPPFPISNEPTSFALLSSRGKTHKEATIELEKAKNQLLRATLPGSE